ncbi:NAD(P)-binding domain-containing protein [Streptomyces sp. NBC_00988]|uniref:NADPH-dependent F420 reductase n=1 Tax=Streptomyces sp. NBC_00988 TaxID=2903704 RepID=UPI0038657941|nr:NAD(P)-binding domain-containing protein [Streptomyces sp. NBC_00988]
MSTISIIGLGTMARVMGARSLAAGHHVQVVGRDGSKAAALAAELGANATAGTVGSGALAGDLVILAVPYAAAASVVGHYGDTLAGKVVVDITNPFDPTSLTGLATPDGSSAAQEIAKAAAPGARLVKAFNTLFSGVLASGEVEGHPLDVFLAGDDDHAKASVSSFVESLGLRPQDTGDLKTAHWLEGAGLLIVGLAKQQKNFALSIKILG